MGRGDRGSRPSGEHLTDHAAPGSPQTRPEGSDCGQRVQKHRERPAMPAVDQFSGDHALPGWSAGAESLFHRLGQQALQTQALLAQSGSQRLHRLPQPRELLARLAHKPLGQIEGTGAAHPARGPPNQLLVDRPHQFRKPRLRFQASLGPAGSLQPVHPVDTGHEKSLRLKLPPPVVTDVGIARGMRLHKQQRPAGGKGRHFLRHAPRTVFLRRGQQQQHIAGGQHRLQQIAIAIGIARPGDQRAA